MRPRSVYEPRPKRKRSAVARWTRWCAWNMRCTNIRFLSRTATVVLLIHYTIITIIFLRYAWSWQYDYLKKNTININMLDIPTSLLAEMSAMFALRCLGILLLPTKTKRADGDIPFILKFVPVSYFTLKWCNCQIYYYILSLKLYVFELL